MGRESEPGEKQPERKWLRIIQNRIQLQEILGFGNPRNPNRK